MTRHHFCGRRDVDKLKQVLTAPSVSVEQLAKQGQTRKVFVLTLSRKHGQIDLTLPASGRLAHSDECPWSMSLERLSHRRSFPVELDERGDPFVQA